MELFYLLPLPDQRNIGLLPADEQKSRVEVALAYYFGVKSVPEAKSGDIEASLATLRAFYKKKGHKYEPPSFDSPDASKYEFKNKDLERAFEELQKQEQERIAKEKQAEEETKRVEEESKQAVDVKQLTASKKYAESKLNQPSGLSGSHSQIQEKLEKYEAETLRFIEIQSYLGKNIEQLEKELAEVKQRRDEQIQRNKELYNEKFRVEEALRTCKATSDIYKKYLEGEKLQATQQFSAADDFAKELEKRNAETVQKIERLYSLNKELQSSLSSVQEQVQQLKVENNTCKEQKAAVEARKYALQDRMTKTEASARELQQTVKQLKEEGTKVRAALSGIKSAISEQDDIFKQSMLLKIRIRVDEFLTSFDKRREKELTRVETKIKHQQADGNEQNFLIKQLKSEVSQQQESVRQATIFLAGEKEKAKRLEKENTRQDVKIEELETELDDLHRRLELKERHIKKAENQLSKLRASMFYSSGDNKYAEEKGPLDPRMRYALSELYAVAAGENEQEGSAFEVLPENVYAIAELFRKRQLEYEDLKCEMQRLHQQRDFQQRMELKLEQNRSRELQAEIQAYKAEAQRERALKQEALGINGADLSSTSTGALFPSTEESAQALYAENAALTRKLVQLKKDIGEDPRELQTDIKTQQIDPTNTVLALSTGEQNYARRYVKIAEFQQVQYNLMAKTAEANALMELLQRRAAAEAEAAAKRPSSANFDEPQDLAQQEIEKLYKSCAELRRRNAELLETLPPRAYSGDYKSNPNENPMIQQIMAANEDLRREINEKDDQLRDVKKDAREQRRELQTQLSDVRRQLETTRATSSAYAAQKRIMDLEVQIQSLRMLNQQLSERLAEQHSGIWGQKGYYDDLNAQFGSQKNQADMYNSAHAQEELALAKRELTLVRNELEAAKLQGQSYVSQLNDVQDAERLRQENVELEKLIADQKKREKRTQQFSKAQEERIRRLEAGSQAAQIQLRELQELKNLLDECVPGMQNSVEKLRMALANHAPCDFVSEVVRMADASVDVCKKIFASAADSMLKETVKEFGVYFGAVYQLASALLKGCAAEEVTLKLREAQAQLRSRLVG